MRKLIFVLPLLVGLMACSDGSDAPSGQSAAETPSASAGQPQVKVNVSKYGSPLLIEHGKVFEFKAGAEAKAQEIAANLEIANGNYKRVGLPESAPEALKKALADLDEGNNNDSPTGSFDKFNVFKDELTKWRESLQQEAKLKSFIVGEAEIAQDGSVTGLKGEGAYLVAVVQAAVTRTQSGIGLVTIPMPSGGLKNVQMDVSGLAPGELAMGDNPVQPEVYAAKAAESLAHYLKYRDK